MDMLILPELPWSDDGAWARAVDFRLNEVVELDIANFPKQPLPRMTDHPNEQSAEIFEAEQSRLAQSFRPISWARPSEADEDLVQFETVGAIDPEPPMDTVAVRVGGSMRGIILHKLMEEVLTGELRESREAVQQRATILIKQLAPEDWPNPSLNAQELAATVLRTLSLPELATDRERLIPEVPVYGAFADDPFRLVSGRADAVRYRGGRAHIIFDWKSDIAPEPAMRLRYAHQLAMYIDALGAERGAIVYMTSSQIQWVDPTDRSRVR
jgi:CRISPR-associated exonuclease Cas4